MKHKYVFYYYRKWPEKHGRFLFFERVSEGKERAKLWSVNFDYQKLY